MIELTTDHYKYMNFGKRYWSADLGHATPEQRKHIVEYVRHFKRMLSEGVGLYLCGQNGTGKTYLSAALMKYAWSTWRVTSYMTTAAELKAAWINEDILAGDGSDETLLYRASNAKLFVIDDLGREHRAKTGFAETQLGALLRERSRNLYTTFITSNMTPKTFAETYGMASSQLLKESMLPILLSGRNMRDEIYKELERTIHRVE